MIEIPKIPEGKKVKFNTEKFFIWTTIILSFTLLYNSDIFGFTSYENMMCLKYELNLDLK